MARGAMARGAMARGSMMVGALGLVLLTSACAGAVAGVAGTTSPSTTTGGSSIIAGPTSDVTEKPTTIVPRPVDPLAGTYVPVKRNGKAAAPTISAASGSFTKPVRYTDGTTVQVTSIRQGTVSGNGPGVFPGQPTTTVVLRLTNGASQAISLNQVVVTARYGNPQRVASPVYDASASDFGGTAAPGAAISATYVFSVPTAHLGGVVMIVDIDGVHVPATFAGAAR